MKMNKKIIALLMTIVLAFGIATSTTLAWLTDRDSAVNVFTVGDVQIELDEVFDQGAQLLPGKDIEKKPYITNTGINDAWVWAAVAVPTLLDDNDASQNVLHFNYDSDFVNDEMWTWTDENGDWMTWQTQIDGRDYTVYYVLYQTPLKAGETTEPVITNVYLDDHIDVDPDGNAFHVVDGVVEDLGWNVYDYAAPTIYVSAFAIQKEGFDSVREGFEGYQFQWENEGFEWAEPAGLIRTEGELRTSIKTSGEYILGNNLETSAVVNINPVAGEPVDLVYHLNGFAINRDSNISGGAGQAIININGCNVTLNGNGRLSSETTLAIANFAGKLVMNGVDVSVDANNNCAINCGGEVTINGGKFSAEAGAIFGATYYAHKDVRGLLTINDATVDTNVSVFTTNNADIVINGGNYATTGNMFVVKGSGKIVINGGTFNVDPSAYVADGHTVTDNGNGTWTVN